MDARPLATDGMTLAIDNAPDLSVTGHCVDRRQLSAACESAQPDVAVVDLELYGNDPQVAVAEIHAQPAAVRARILLLASDYRVERLAAALLSGAQNCISSFVGRGEFLRAVRATSAGKLLIPDAWSRKLAYRMVDMRNSRATSLSPREVEVLRLAAGGLPVAEIAQTLFISTNTARTHLHRIYNKLGVHNRTGAIAAALRAGVIPLPTDPGS